MRASPGAVRLGIVLSAGGLRGAAHLGVLRRLLAHGVPFDVMVGVSAGAIVVGYYAAVGLSVEDMIGDAPTFRGRHLLMHGLLLRAPAVARPFLRLFTGVIPRRLRQLEDARFDVLHHGVQSIGIVCHDLVSNRPFYVSSADHSGIPLDVAVKSSAALPRLMPPRTVILEGQRLQLIDGGVSDSLPYEFAQSALGATHLIVSDCRRESVPGPLAPSIVYIGPELDDAAILRSPVGTLLETVARGEAAVTRDVLASIDRLVAGGGVAHGGGGSSTCARVSAQVAAAPGA